MSLVTQYPGRDAWGTVAWCSLGLPAWGCLNLIVHLELSGTKTSLCAGTELASSEDVVRTKSKLGRTKMAAGLVS